MELPIVTSSIVSFYFLELTNLFKLANVGFCSLFKPYMVTNEELIYSDPLIQQQMEVDTEICGREPDQICLIRTQEHPDTTRHKSPPGTQEHPDAIGLEGPRSTQTPLDEEDSGLTKRYWTKRTQKYPRRHWTAPESSPPTPRTHHCHADKAEENNLKKAS
ncbi:hypothetical protein STEG23_014023 [Scotinomys teguina]